MGSSTAALLAFFAALIPFFDANTVLSLQNNLVNTIARLSKIEDNQNTRVQQFLRQLGIQRNDAKESAVPITLALGKAAIRYFLDEEEINGVKQNYKLEEKRSMPEIGATPNISEIEKKINSELSN